MRRTALKVTLLGCLLATGCGATAPTAPTPTPAAPTTPSPAPAPAPATPHAPVISNLAAHFSGGPCTRAADHLTGSALVVTFDYADSDGDLAGGRAVLNRLYNTGRSESHTSLVPSEVTLTGSSTSGQLRIENACPLYDDNSTSRETLTLVDARGLESNSLTVMVSRPPGAP